MNLSSVHAVELYNREQTKLSLEVGVPTGPFSPCRVSTRIHHLHRENNYFDKMTDAFFSKLF